MDNIGVTSFDKTSTTNIAGVCAVYVTYNPNLVILEESLASIIQQVELVVLVDNGSSCQDLVKLIDKFFNVSLVKLGENRGIAAAQNIGISLSKEKGMRTILLMDQDSVPDREMVRNLCSVKNRLVKNKKKIAALGPILADATGKPLSSFKKRVGIFEIEAGSEMDGAIECSGIVASGSLIDISVLDSVGGFLEELFIDYVDIEWGLRARQIGFQFYGVPSAILQHRFGDYGRNVLGKYFSLRAPFRYYYIVRNGIFLALRNDLPISWRISEFFRVFGKILLYPIIHPKHSLVLKFVAIGMLHGFIGKKGKLRDR